MGSLEEFKGLSEEDMIKEVEKVLPLLSPLCQMFSDVQETVMETVSRLEAVETLVRAEEDAESLNSVDTASNTPPSPDVISRSRRVNKRVTINVGGVRHDVLWKVLELLPYSRLGLLAKSQSHEEILSLCSDYNLQENEYFFDIHPRSFNTILNFYRTGKLHITDDVCVLALSDDLFYWRIDEALFDSCCLDKFIDKRELLVTEMERAAHTLEVEDAEDFGVGVCARYQRSVWDLMEKPESSRAAKVVSVISLSFVFVSIVGMVISTLPALQYQARDGSMVENPWLSLIETISIAWFTLEYFLRFAGAPKKWAFLVDTLNIIDVLSILPFFVSLFLDSNFSSDFLDSNSAANSNSTTTTTTPAPTTSPSDGDDGSGSLEDILQIFRIFKLARVLKLARHSPGLQAIAYTLKHSYKELALLVFLMGITSLIIGSLCYFIELDQESGFTSIPTAIYYCVITMTTVVYGDIYPTSGLG